jgi:hypothetical protein
MAAIPGSVPITGFIAPTDTNDIFATQDETYNRGGFRTVADLTARDAITPDRRLEGMLVRVLSNAKFYTLSGGITNSNWVEEAFSGGTAGAMVYKGDITLPAHFPTPGAVQVGWTYGIKADVTDNDPTKTNTSQSFVAGDLIVWNGVNWSDAITAYAAKDVPYDNSTSGLSATNVNAAIDEVAAATVKPFKADLAPVETPNGILTTFTLPGGDQYVSGSLQVHLNGVMYAPGSIVEVVGRTQFTISGDHVPTASDSLAVSYVKD